MAYIFTPEQRADALRAFFGWQGGTIHQLESATGCDSYTLLYQDIPDLGPLNSLTSRGFSAIRTCGKAWRIETLAPKHQGNWLFWAGVIIGFNVTTWQETE